jgi:hypothetical protein
MISVAVKGCGLVLWHETGEWHVYAADEDRAETLALQIAGLLRVTGTDHRRATRDLLLSMDGAVLLVDTDVPECDGTCGGACQTPSDPGSAQLN